MILSSKNNNVLFKNTIANAIVISDKIQVKKEIIPYTQNNGEQKQVKNNEKDYIIQDLGRKEDCNNDLSFVWQHFSLNTETMLVSCKYCNKKYQEEINLRKVLHRHLIYHHKLIDFPQFKVKANEQKQQIDSDEEDSQIRAIRVLKSKLGLKSQAYNHYIFNYHTQTAHCRYCMKTIPANHGVVAMALHLKRFHPGMYTQPQIPKKSQFVSLQQPQQEKKRNPNYDLKIRNKQIAFSFACPKERIYEILFENFKIERQYSQKLLNQINWNIFKNDGQMFEVMRRKGITICEIEGKKHYLFFSQKMKKNYRKYGQKISINISLLHHYSQFKNLAVLTSNDQANSQICLAFIIFQEDIRGAYFSSALCQYFARMAKMPETVLIFIQTILVENGWNVKQTFKEINQSFKKVDHNFIPFQIESIQSVKNVIGIKFFRRNYSFQGFDQYNQGCSKINILLNELVDKNNSGRQYNFLQKLCLEVFKNQNFELGKNVYETYQIKMLKSIDEIIQKIQSFKKDQNQFQSIKQIIIVSEKRIIQRQYFLETLGEYLKKWDKVLSNVELFHLSNQMVSNIFKILLQQYQESNNLKLIKTKQFLSFHVKQKNAQNLISPHVKYSLQYCHWNCSCFMLQKTGIPCRHLFAVINKYKGALTYYINPRWLAYSTNQDELKTIEYQISKKGFEIFRRYQQMRVQKMNEKIRDYIFDQYVY